MPLTLFDLDNTLISIDSDHMWGEYIVSQGLANTDYRQQNDQFFQDYKAEKLDVIAYLNFVFAGIEAIDSEIREKVRQDFVQKCIFPHISKESIKLVNHHKDLGEITIIITSTNNFIVEPIAAIFAPDVLICSTQQDGIISPCFREHKLKRLEEWLEYSGETLEESWAYSDSINDLPLLEAVKYPVVVNADEKLEKIAEKYEWAKIKIGN